MQEGETYNSGILTPLYEESPSLDQHIDHDLVVLLGRVNDGGHQLQGLGQLFGQYQEGGLQ